MALPEKHPSSVEPYFIVWCDADGTNVNNADNSGELAGATIASSTWTVPTGITKASSDTGAVVIGGVSYAVNTVSTIWLTGGTDGQDYDLLCVITTSDSRTLARSIRVPVRSTAL